MARRPPKFFNLQRFNFYGKECQKWPYLDLQSFKRNKVMNFGKPTADIVAMVDKFGQSGSHWPMVMWNRVNNQFLLYVLKLKICANQNLYSVLRYQQRRVLLCCDVHQCCYMRLRAMRQVDYAVLCICIVICALSSGWDLRELLYPLLYICVVICDQILTRSLGELFYAMLHICAVICA